MPAEHQIRGLGPIAISVPEPRPTDTVLRDVLGMRQDAIRGADGARPTSMRWARGARSRASCRGRAGACRRRSRARAACTTSRSASRTQDYEAWDERLRRCGIPSSGPVDRFYFRSLYFREPNGILFEIATDGPALLPTSRWRCSGDKLSLPPFLEGRRQEIETKLKPL